MRPPATGAAERGLRGFSSLGTHANGARIDARQAQCNLWHFGKINHFEQLYSNQFGIQVSVSEDDSKSSGAFVLENQLAVPSYADCVLPHTVAGEFLTA